MTRRDWMVLPAIGLLTICLLLTGAEMIARGMFSATKTNSLDCLIMNDADTGVRAIPNCVCRQKVAESELVEYRFNSCGHRAGEECGPKRAGRYRMVLIGSSVAEGLRVRREKTFAALLPDAIRRGTGREVDVYNEGLQWGTPRRIELGFKEVLAAQPDVILWAVTPWDVENVSETIPDGTMPDKKRGGQQVAQARGIASLGHKLMTTMMERSRTVTLLQHFLYRSPNQYVKQFLEKGVRVSFLKVDPGAAWEARMKQFDRYAAELERRAAAAGIPFVTTVLPTRTQAAMLSMGAWPAGYDPYKFGDEVRAVVERHGGSYVDVLHEFRSIADSQRYFYAVDGHPNPEGHVVYSKLLAKGLTGGAVPALKRLGLNSFATLNSAAASGRR